MGFEKKGQLATYQIVIIVLAIVGLIVVLLFFFAFKDSVNTGNDICHLSVLTRATSPQALQSFVPLKCTTNKICLTSNSNSKCADSFAGEQGVTVINLPSDSESAARMIEQTSADAMYNCWSVMGQGKLDLFGNFQKFSGLWTDINNIKPYCTICSRVAVDSSVSTDVLNNVNIYSYMKSNIPSGQSLTYLQLFTDQQFNSYPVVDSNLFQQKIRTDSSGDTISSTGKQISFVFMQIKANSPGQVLSNLAEAGAITTGGAFLTGPTRSVASVLLLSGGTSAILTRIAVAGAGAVFAGLNAYSGQVMAAGYCGAFTTQNGDSSNGGTSGCSIVEAVPYNAQSINQICGTIEGSP